MSPEQHPSPRGRGNVWRHCHDWEGAATGIYWVGTRDIAKSYNIAQDAPPPHRTAENGTAPNADGNQVGNPRSRRPRGSFPHQPVLCQFK